MKNPFIPHNHPELPRKTGVLIINLGTPKGYDPSSIRKYLKEFLSDKRVIETPAFLWKIILNLFILPFRPKVVGKKYKSIWFHKKNLSPLKYYTQQQAEKLQKHLKGQILVDYAMRYGDSSIESKIHSLIKQGCDKILFIPLYPQYCAATTATAIDEIYRVIRQLRWQPTIRVSTPYHNEAPYIKALVSSLKKHQKSLSWSPDAILSSYHGIPKTYFDKGDPYPCVCQKTHRLFSALLKKEGVNIPTYMSFQSRFGPKQWIQPYTEDMIKNLLDKGVKNLLMIAPGFSVDCIETLEEINIEYKDFFIKNGGKNFSLVPCLNDSKEGMDVIFHLLKKNIWH